MNLAVVKLFGQWLGDVLRLAALSKGILAIVPFGSPLNGAASASALGAAIAVARREVPNPKTTGLAAELLAILQDPGLRQKTVVGVADIVGSGIVSNFASMRTFMPIDSKTLDEHFLSGARGDT